MLENKWSGWSHTVRGETDADLDVAPVRGELAGTSVVLFAAGVYGRMFPLFAVGLDISRGVTIWLGFHGSVIMPESTNGILGTGGCSDVCPL